MTKVSVLMAVYNTKEEFLRESIQSILDQTFQDFEFIIVDDGSKNNPEEIVKSFNDGRIKFYKNDTNSGVAYTRNRLIDLAQGEYIAFQDSDDISFPTRLEKQVKFLNENPNFSGVSAGYETFPNKKIVLMISEPKILDFLGGCKFTQPCSMLRINDFKKYNLKYNEKLKTSEDYDLWSRCIEKIRLYNLEEVLLKYRRNPNSLVHTKKKEMAEADFEIKQRLLDKLTSDKKLQKEIIKVASKLDKKQSSFFEKLFSIRNEWNGMQKRKILQILGIKIFIKKN